MGVVRTMVTTLFLSAWLMVHAVFLANLPPEEAMEKKLLPLQIRWTVNAEEFPAALCCLDAASVFHMPWFRTLVSNHMNVEMLRFSTTSVPQQQSSSSVWTALFPSSGSSSPGGRGNRFVSYSSRSKAASGAAAVPDRNAEDWLRPLSWAVTAMTMAEWLTFSYFVWRVLWLTILRPLVVVISFILILLLGFYCVKGYYYAIGDSSDSLTQPYLDHYRFVRVATLRASSLSPDDSSAVLPYITAVDEFLHAAGKELLSWNGRVLRGLDQLLSVVFTPASVLERQQQDRQQLLLGKKQQNTTDMMSAAAGLFDLLHRVQLLLGGGTFEGVPASVRPRAGGMEL